MSRSYRKVFSNPYRTRNEPLFRRGKQYRSQCRICIHREKTNPEYGDVVFPSYRSFPKTAHYTCQNTRNEIRQGYYRDIQEILNRYTMHNRDQRTDEIFVEIVNQILGFTPNTDIGSEWYFHWPMTHYFKWLNHKKVKMAVKSWNGDPFDVLKFLTDKGYIEKAVRLEFKLCLAK